MQKTVWGVLSTAKIGVNKVIPALMQSDLIRVKGLASRNFDAAKSAVETLGLEAAYGSYEDLLADPEIEVIYNPLPNHLHVPMTLAAARAGKHVLCEKPMALNAAELDQLAEVSHKVHIMEAFMVRHSLQWLEARRLIREGAIGAPKIIQSWFSYNNMDANNIRNKVEWGGGGLMDIGCYPIVAGRFFFEAEPVRVMALISRDATFGTDTITSGLLDFGEGRQLTFAVSTALTPGQGVTIMGDKARLSLSIPFNQPPDAPQVITVDDGQSFNGATAVTHTLQPSNQYTLMGEAFTSAVRGESPLPYGIEDARINMRIIDALFRSETSGRWEAVSR
ncbi:Gfo/Idh/MocA family protein [Asticcacaulis taihuensis]|jgi:predicted dehydrogenase|uniref:Predicted dehydrogenase n=1 Tax=Asticcacaulis taihuensis TaxID=260084 RepID=A0A1G4SUH9_9CAUL|nr:Gfo/Idh/MocA family oxidoreductase [Asticcacaulis taihuensis]SCW72607.1 Predicted dehydrogenase [Asticcacaulis taihuensis]